MSIKFKNKTGILLLLFIVAAFLLADGLYVISYPPRAVHQWRQSDCVAYARNYYTKHSGLLTPSFYNQISTDGRSISEIPLLYYIAGNLFHVFGFHYWVLRGLTFLCYIIGLFYLYRCISMWLSRPLLVIFPVVILATTPFFYYYAVNSLPNVPAICLAFPGLYYMLRYGQTGQAKHIIISTLFFILSSLLKPTDGGIIWMAYLCTTCSAFLARPGKDKRTLYVVISAAVISLCIYAWYRYALWYNAANNNDLNLLGIFPIWDMDYNDIRDTFRLRMAGIWGSSYQATIILALVPVFLLIYRKKQASLHPFLNTFTGYLLWGTLAYDILWFKAFGDIDYYQLINVIAPVFLTVCLFEYYERELLPKANKYVAYAVDGLLVALMLVSIFHNRDVQRERYADTKFSYTDPSIYEVEPYLRQIGIAPTDRVVSVPDPSPNITLTAFGNPGYTGELFGNGRFNIPYCRTQGAKYLIITDSAWIHKPAYEPYTSKPIGRYKGIFIYDIR